MLKVFFGVMIFICLWVSNLNFTLLITKINEKWWDPLLKKFFGIYILIVAVLTIVQFYFLWVFYIEKLSLNFF